MSAVVIRWTNKFSGEQGYVGSVSTKNRCFYNAPDRNGAKLYSSEKAANKVITQLTSYGEAENNDFEVLAAG